MSRQTHPRPFSSALVIASLVLLQYVTKASEASKNLQPIIAERDAENKLLLQLVSRQASDLQRLQAKVSSLEGLEGRVQKLEQLLLKHGDVATHRMDAAEVDSSEYSTTGDKRAASKGNPVGPSTGQFRVTRQYPEKVAFSAVLSTDVHHINRGDAIKFTKILLNHGSGYNPSTGIFTAPSPGTYLFSYNIGHFGHGEMWFQLMKNGQRLNDVASDGTFNDHNMEISNTAILDLAIGDNVWVNTVEAQSSTALKAPFTTFSGILFIL